MKNSFRHHKKFNASVFDLLSGTSEVKQTTALGYLLSQDDCLLLNFLNYKDLNKALKNYKFNNNDISNVVVHTELTSLNNKRIDIAILIYRYNKKPIAILVEAKSITVNLSFTKIIPQIKSYISSNNFPNLHGFIKIGCILNKKEVVNNNTNIVSISWRSVIDMLRNGSDLSLAYLNFLMRLSGEMHFYEEEVISIPAGISYGSITEYPHIYECPNSGRYLKMKSSLYFTFRKSGGGEMDSLYKVDNILIINPAKDLNYFMDSNDYDSKLKDRVKCYCDNNLKCKEGYVDEEKQFFILSTENKIDLSKKPRPTRNNSFVAYYRICDLLNKSIV